MIACALLSACFSKPGFHTPPDDGSGSATLHGVTVVGNGVTDDMTVSTDDLQLHFPMLAINLPDGLKIGGVEVLAEQTACQSENKIGLALYPVYSITSGGTTWPTANGDTHDSAIVRTASGPAFAQASITWGGVFHCGANAQTVSGTSVFSVFPDGRVVRDDSFMAPTTTQIGTQACGCSGSTGNYFLTSFVTLLNARFSHLGYNASTNNLPMPTETPLAPLHDADSVENPNPRWACMENRDAAGAQQRRFGIVWPATVTPTADDGGTRIKLEIDSAPTPMTTLIYDWTNNGSSIRTGSRGVSVAWFVDAGPGATCAASTMTELFNGYATARKLDVDGGAGVVKVPLDVRTGIYVVSGAPAASYAIRVEDATTGVPAGFAISLTLPTDAAPVVRMEGALLVDGVDYLTQHAGNAHTLWFPNALPQAQVLVISQ